jgi:hypothetical protein
MADDGTSKQAPSEDENFDITSSEVVTDEPVVEEPLAGTSEESAVANTAVEDRSDEFVDVPDAVPAVLESDTQDTTTSAEPDEPITPPAPLPTEPVTKASKKPIMAKGVLRFVAEAVLLVVIVVLALMVANLKSDKSDLTKQLASANANPQALVTKQTDELIATVSKLMQLPTGETPTVAEVSDAASAKKQSAFFTNAQNGDKVLLYSKAAEAILYRPSTDKIILVAPLNLSSGTTSTAAGTTKQ